jgi:hypothetical protein
MEDLFKGSLPEGEECDLHIYIFPHLNEFLTIDVREPSPVVHLLDTGIVFGEKFYTALEQEFGSVARQGNSFTFSHLINLPLRMEEIIRDLSMSFILEEIGVDPDDEESVPSVVVFVISGGALGLHSDKLIEGVRHLLQNSKEELPDHDWGNVLSRLVEQENSALQTINQTELSEAFSGDFHDYFTLWENRN